MASKLQKLSSLLVAFLLCGLSFSQTTAYEIYKRPEEQSTQRPIIGIVTLPVTVRSQRRHGYQSFATSYVRWVEAGGGRVAPIFFDSTKEQLDYILNRVNGVFFTGGLVDFNPTHEDEEGSAYLRTTEYIMNHVLSENRKGNYYPMWGTCLGFERITQLLANDVNATLLDQVDAENLDISLDFTKEGWLSRLFGGMSYDLFKQVASPLSHLAFNNHGLGIHPEKFVKAPVNDFLTILSIDHDRKGVPFVSTVEGREFPIYGSQWHPEKAPWEWSTAMAITHIDPALKFSNYLGRYFVNECKYNKNKFADDLEEAKVLIYNWRPRPTGELYHMKSGYTQIYFFRESRWRLSAEAAEAYHESLQSRKAIALSDAQVE